MNDQPTEAPEFPAVARPVAERLCGADAASGPWWTGESLARAVEGRTPRSLRLLCAWPLEDILRALPEAVLVGSVHPRARVVLNDPQCRWVDVVSSAPAAPVEALDAAPFTRRAIALRFVPHGDDAVSSRATPEWLDPHAGLPDLRARRLAVTFHGARAFDRAPSLAIRAFRYIGEQGLTPSDALAEALEACKPELRGVAVPRARDQLRSLLLHTRPSGALAALHASAFGEKIAPGVPGDAPPVVQRVEARLDWRLTAWLRGAPASRVLRRLRFGAALAGRVLLLLEHHPLDGPGRGLPGQAAARQRRRLSPDDLDFLIRLRGFEIDELEKRDAAAAAQARASLARILEAHRQLERDEATSAARRALVMRGEDVMEHLTLAPSPRVGEALQHLAELVARGACANERPALETALDAWNRRSLAGTPLP